MKEEEFRKVLIERINSVIGKSSNPMLKKISDFAEDLEYSKKFVEVSNSEEKKDE